MRRFLTIVVVLTLLAVAVNDISRYAKAKSRLSEATIQLAKYAANQAVSSPPETVAAQIKPMGEPLGVTVYQYAQENNKVALWTETQVSGTIVIGTAINMVEGMPFSEARTKPFRIREFKRSGI